MWNEGWGMGWGWGSFGLLHLLAWAALIAGVVALLRRGLGFGGAGAGDRALRILRERYARGEIDRAEFEERRQQLEAGGV